MSENIDPTLVVRMNNLPELLKKPDQQQDQPNNIFDLINHLGDGNKNSNQKELNSSTPTDSQSQLESQSSEVDLILNSIEPIQICDGKVDTKSKIPTGIPKPRVHSASAKASPSAGAPLKSSIPRMATSKSIPVASSVDTQQRVYEIDTQKNVSSPAVEAYAPKPPISGLKKPTPIQSLKPNNLAESTNTTTTTNTVNKQRVSPRSFSREVVSGEVTPSRKSVEEKPKRGMSLSAGVSVNSLSSDSTGTSKSKPKKTVRYAVRHKPRESKVKIFSQKVEIRNVSSKIGSLDNYNHKPAGGDVVIETRELNWNAQSKIGSLEKAATYVPNGGNVKIENHKLNWQAKAKIGSLEKAATYVPHGGNVKIENRKLDFKSKARPKTDTGLIYIEDDDDDDYNSSQNVSGENLNDTQDLSS